MPENYAHPATHENLAETIERLIAKENGVNYMLCDDDFAGVPYVIVPKGYDFKTLAEWMPTPARKRQVVTLVSLDSFIGYVLKFQTPETEIFQVKETGFRAVFNYCRPGQAAWCDDVLRYDPVTTSEWAEWTMRDKQIIPQDRFCQFIEDQSQSFISPDTGAMLDIAKFLDIKSSVAFTAGLTLETGDVKISYQEQTDATMRDGTKTFPSNIVLGLQIHEGGPRYQIPARFRYHPKDRKLNFQFTMRRPDLALKDAVKGMREKITAETGLKVWLADSQ